MGWNLLGGLMPPAVDTAGESERRHSGDSGTEEEFEILGREEIKERRYSGDSGDESQEEADVRDSDVEPSVPITLQFQLTQSLLSQVKASENNRDANSGKQAYKDLPRMDFVINGQVIDKNFVSQLRDKCNQNDQRQIAKHVFTKMFEHAKAEIPNDNLLEELITSCNQAGYDGSLLMQLSLIFLGNGLQLPDANDRHIEIVCSDQDSLNVKYCPNMPVKQLGKEICRVDAILEFTLKFRDSKVEYENGKVTFAIPEQLENYKADGKSLLDEINRHFEDEDNRITETLEKNMNEGPKSFAAEDLSITESSSDSSEVANKVVTDPGILGNVANVLVGVAEVTAVVATELFWPQGQVNIEPRHNEEEFTITPKNLTFDGLIDVINKAKNYGDYADLDKTINNIEESDRFITDLNCGNLKDFCFQQLNLTDHMHNVLLNNSYDETNGYYNYSVKELSLLAIAADDTLVERYAETHKSILFTQDEGLDRLLIGVGGQCYIKFLLEHLDKPNHTMFLDGICKKLERASFVGNQKCVEVILNRFKNTEAEGRIIFSSKLLHYAIHLAPESKAAEVIVNRKVVDINSIDNSGIAPLHYAVARNNLELMGLLIGNGAEIDIQDERHGRTALHWAAYHDKFEIVKLLVNKGADWNIQDRDGKTALDLVGTKSLYLVREENREKSSSESKITKFLEGLDDKTPLHLNIKKDPESKNIDNQQPQRNVVDKVENIMNNEEASIEEAIGNNCEEGKMPKNIEEKLSSAVSSIDLADVMYLLRKVDDSVYKSTLQKLLGQANDKMTSLGEGNQKEDLAQIIALLKNEFEHIDALSVGNDVEATASSQEAPLVESKESSPSLSSEEDDFSNLEGNKSDCSAGTSSDSNSNSPFEKISEEGHETRISVIDTVEAEATANGTVSSNSVPCTLRVELTSDDEDEFLSIEIEDVNNDINVNQPTEHVEQVANGNGQPKTELPRINEQSSKSGLKKNPQNTKKYVVAAAALAIAGIVSGVAVAVYLEMLAVGIAVAACCLIAATVTYCCRPKSLIENGEPAEIVFKERSVY
ncbi:ankyrin repeat domain-containing protein [Wolbachia endosymbiont (group B) of Melanostoma mellinum]|uniref:ankyrin repeat domain-containing protein n=1 Tax=Wolbachia endosymbiont (group B) of Melanostoma mellinum TaxID=2954030 RepID=UPI00222FF4CB|nr:ankyrin repeat domain-containing protein [Wolbachia endosymbiont (group B) of Melanostoma mellinum]